MTTLNSNEPTQGEKEGDEETGRKRYSRDGPGWTTAVEFQPRDSDF